MWMCQACHDKDEDCKWGFDLHGKSHGFCERCNAQNVEAVDCTAYKHASSKPDKDSAEEEASEEKENEETPHKEMDYFSQLLAGMMGLGGPKPPENTIKETLLNRFATLCILQMVKQSLSPQERRNLVESFFLSLRQQMEEEVENHKAMMNSALGKLFGGFMPKPEDIETKFEEMRGVGKQFLCELLEIAES